MFLLNRCSNKLFLSGISADPWTFFIEMNCRILYGPNCKSNGKKSLPEKDNLSPLSPAIKSVSQLLKEDDVEGIIIGGLAVSLLGRPRFTNDIDLMILDLDDRLPEFIEKLKKYGIRPRVDDAIDFARKSRVLLMRHMESGINIDISMGIMPFERESVGRRKIESSFGLEVPLPLPEDLIIFKAISRRPQDIEDIKSIIARHPNIDKERILIVVREFADILESEEISSNIKNLLQ
jgi:predicted nucleotidyltransferase